MPAWTPETKRLASLTALGAGVLAVGAQPVSASIISSSPSGVYVGASPSGTSSYIMNLPGNADLPLYRSTGESFSVGLRGPDSIRVATVGGAMLQAFKAGQDWGLASASSTFARAAVVTSNGGRVSEFDATKKYFLFTFEDSTAGNALRYGWGEFAITYPSNHPVEQLVSWAYDTTGAEIKAGDTGATAPEPTSAALAGVGALMLGARGIRRWRAARKTQVQATEQNQA